MSSTALYIYTVSLERAVPDLGFRDHECMPGRYIIIILVIAVLPVRIHIII